MDDRTPEERGLAPLRPGQLRLPKSRYSSVSSYLSPRASPRYQAADVPINQNVYTQLLAGGVDDLLAHHLANLFVRDPLVIYDSKIHLDDATHADHFENIQSTNWQTVRFKPPPPQSDIGWRVEFRPMEVQLTDFENAAFATFVILLARAITRFDLSFYAPMSRVEANMATAHHRGAAQNERFYWRTHAHKGLSPHHIFIHHPFPQYADL